MEAVGILLDPTRLLASVVKFLIVGGENDLAAALLECRVEIVQPSGVSPDGWVDNSVTEWTRDVTLRGPRRAYDTLSNSDNQHRIETVINAHLRAELS